MSSHLDNSNSYPGKRARTDGGRREDDWTCPSCGNINFSFRTTCNMRNCTQSRPVNHNMKTAPKPLHVPPAYSSSASYMSSGSPSSMYLGGAPYGSSFLNRSNLLSYEFPFSEGYDFGQYGGRVPVGSPYGPMHFSGPPYSGQSMMGAGGMYGVPPLMDRYSFGMPMDQGAMGLRTAYLDEIPIKRPSGCDNDWICPNCGNQNFAFRNVCNMRKCSNPKPESQASKAESSKGTKSKMPEGSWKCLQCNNINYPFRIKCNRQNCGADKPSEQNECSAVKSDKDDQ